ncbi:uncharacterized protein LOC134022403 [Osmerus eperlanus]|uniref:uncharacterized protein LOC134022403 n=1 Tax=Osmerus eperlanus TaxID=29151 RepID=UPI002E122B5D
MKLSWLPLAELSSSSPRKGALIAMDSTGNESGVHTAKKKKVAAEDRNWHNRLRLRKAAVQPPTMQSEDKHKSVKITEDREQHMKQTSLKIKSACKPTQSKRWTNTTGDILRFRCSECEDSNTFSAKGLLGHFKLRHQASRPVFPCDMCTFNTHELACLQVHVLGHQDTFTGCVVCNDNVQRTLSELTTHLDMQHKVKGLYLCERCKFSVSDVGAFLEHMYLHCLTMCDNGGQSGHADMICKEPIKATIIPHRYESPLNCTITKHIATVHGEDRCQKTKQRMRRIHETVIDSTPRPRHRMTRKAAREMCWMSQDCLSLPGKEFLDKYCNLSDPGTALEESRHFLERSVVAESGTEKWTKALQTVLSNVPQCQMSENGPVSNPGNDLTVLMVKNKISVPQNRAEAIGLTMVEGKRDTIFNVMPSEKQDIVPAETCSEILCPTAHVKTCQPNLDLHLTQPTNAPGSLFFQNEFSGCNQSLENGENQRVRFDQKEHGDYRRQHSEEPQNANLCEKKTKELKLTKMISEKEKSTKETHLANRKRSRRRKAFRPKIVNKPPPGLKLFLKKDPVKEMQWTSQGPSLVAGGSLLEQYHSFSHPQITLEETQQFLHRALTEKGGLNLTKETKADQLNILKALTASSQLTEREGPVPNPGQFSVSDFSVLEAQQMTSVSHNCSTNAMGFKMVDVENHFVHSVMPSSEHRAHHEIVVGLPSFEAEVGNATSERCTTVNLNSLVVVENQTNSRFSSDTLKSSELYSHVENALIQNTNLSPKNIRGNQDGNDEAKSNKELTTQPEVVMTKGMTHLIDDPCHILHETVSVSRPQPNEQKVTAKKPSGTSTDGCPEPFSKANKTSSQSPGREALLSMHHWKPAPKHAERTLKLLPLSPTQLIKRPNEDQPVVVLNHPDTDIPEVTNIMEVVHRYQGEVQKVVLSRSTLKALSALECEMAWRSDPTKSCSPSRRRMLPENTVKERFILKLKLKKMSRKKYKVVDADSHNTNPPLKFDCWFCGRVFSNQEMWICHGQRHLMESKRRSCET